MHIRLKILITALGLSALGLIVLAATRRPLPSDEALRSRFIAHRTDFEKLVVMANEDSQLTRIAPNFTWLKNDVSWPRKNVGISQQRWNEYRQIFRRVGASDGIEKGKNPNRVIFPIVYGGLVPSGFTKGLIYSQSPLSPILSSLDKRPPDKYWTGSDHSHVLVYKPIEDHWYIYYEQW